MIIPKLILFLITIGAISYLHHAMFYAKGNAFVVMVRRWPPDPFFHAFWGLVKGCLILAFALWIDGDQQWWWALLLWPVSDLWFRHLLNKFNGQPWWYMGNGPKDARAWFDLLIEWMTGSLGRKAPSIVAMSIELLIAATAVVYLTKP